MKNYINSYLLRVHCKLLKIVNEKIVTVFSRILGYGGVVHTLMGRIRFVPCNQQKDCILTLTLSINPKK